jgi:tRNA modification GTPase
VSERDTDTIAAVITPPGRGGVGIVRLSGPLSFSIAEQVASKVPEPRMAHYGPFVDNDKSLIDNGILLCFKAPNSYTGEDVVEFQAHGGPVVLDR